MLTGTLDNRDDEIWLLSPALGLFHGSVKAGQWVHAGDVIGELEILNKRLPVLLPEGAGVLRVLDVTHFPFGAVVQYHGRLLQLLPADVADTAIPAQVAEAADLGLPEGAMAVRASIDGQYYSAASPEDPPFVSEGEVLSEGKIIGLIEVMKFFYEVAFELPTAHANWRVVRVAAANASPLLAGDPIIWVVPA